MKYSVVFQYRPPGSARPPDYAQDEAIVVEDGAYIPLPDVGDSVAYLGGGKMVARKVVTRHFSLLGDHLAVNVVVTDIDPKEMASRLKE